jgi:hypothetical protein
MGRIKEFPGVIHVKVIQDTEDDYLSACTGGFPDALGDDEKATVAMYKLISVKKVTKAFPHVKNTRSKKTK